VLVVVAHPDDETIGCGAQLPRFSDIRVIHVTDGAPRNGADAAQLGFAGPADYAAARRRELQAPMALAGISPERLVALGWPDQEASLHLAEIATELARRLSGCELALTHAYEGGHPDHDATAFAVHAACALLRRRGSAPAIIEMPLYRSGGSEWAVQSFVPEPEIAVAIAQLGPEERRLKQVMLAAFASQAHVLARFSLTEEPFRRAPRYDFRQLPNGGQLLYEQQQWGMTGARWRELAAAALAALDLQPSP
jgi:LmbE family N-acetylglucosaminyl deacetylase